MIPEYVRKAAGREFPCICLDDYKLRGRVDPACRHDDMEHALESAWEALHPPTCCVRCRAGWEAQVRSDGAPFALVVARPMFICTHCGDKRCPQADDHRRSCQNA